MNLLGKSQTYRIWLPESKGATDKPLADWKTTASGQVEITNGDEIHKKIFERNKVHLQQAKDTPFVSTKLGKMLKFDGSGELTDDLLKGNADDTGLEGFCKQYLEGLKVKKYSNTRKSRC